MTENVVTFLMENSRELCIVSVVVLLAIALAAELFYARNKTEK